MIFDEFGLHPTLMAGIRDMGYRDATPIQEKAIPACIEGRDVIGVAQTGTGKTAAFLLPILHRQLTISGTGTRALILAPTRELATQIDDVRLGLAYHTTLSGCVVYGGADMANQTRALRGGPNIVTATPGRLLDHLWHGMPKLDAVEVLVLDEADRMMDMGFLPDLEKILRRLPAKRQNLLFSATMPREIERLADEMMNDPIKITVGRKSQPVDRVKQEVYSVSAEGKADLLRRLLLDQGLESVLVFTKTKVGANRVYGDLMRRGFSVGVIHGDRTQEERFRSLEAFRHGQLRVLVATDVASRGIDVDGISHVINYDVPRAGEDYVHRIGRTARAGESGHAVTFVSREEERDLSAIEREIRMKITRVESPSRPMREPPPRERHDRDRGRHDARGNERRPESQPARSAPPKEGDRGRFHGGSDRPSRNGARQNRDRDQASRASQFAPERPTRDPRPARDERPPRDEPLARDPRPARDERPARDPRPPRDERPARDSRPPRDERPARDDPSQRAAPEPPRSNRSRSAGSDGRPRAEKPAGRGDADTAPRPPQARREEPEPRASGAPRTPAGTAKPKPVVKPKPGSTAKPKPASTSKPESATRDSRGGEEPPRSRRPKPRDVDPQNEAPRRPPTKLRPGGNAEEKPKPASKRRPPAGKRRNDAQEDTPPSAPGPRRKPRDEDRRRDDDTPPRRPRR